MTRFSTRYAFAQPTVSGWVKKYSDPTTSNHDRGGRPDAISSQGLANMFAEIEQGKTVKGSRGRDKKALFTDNEVNQLANKHSILTKRERGADVWSEDESQTLSRNTQKKYKKVFFRYKCCFS